MDTVKMKELEAELEADIRLRQEALQAIRKLRLALDQPAGEKMRLQDSAYPILFAASDSYVDLAVKVINANDNKPMRMNDIVSRIRILKGNPNIQRRSVESTLIQHARTKGDMSRIYKIRRGVWSVRRFHRDLESVSAS